MGWRLVYKKNYNGKYFTKGKVKNVYRLNFEASDIKVIIFPDEKTKQMSFNEDAIKSFFSQHMPIIVTLEDCGNF